MKASPRELLERVLRRQSCLPCPEAELLISVFGLAVQDAFSSSPSGRYHANRFLAGDDAAYLAGLIGVDIDFIREFLARARPFYAPKVINHVSPQCVQS